MQLNAAARDDNKSTWSEAADRWIENSNEEEKESIRRTLNELTNNQMSSEERDAAGIEQPTNTGVNQTRHGDTAAGAVSLHRLCRCTGCVAAIADILLNL